MKRSNLDNPLIPANFRRWRRPYWPADSPSPSGTSANPTLPPSWIAEREGNRRAAASPQAAHQAVALNLVYVDALVLSGRIEAVALGDRVCRLWAADIPRVPHTVATAINGMAALAHGDLAQPGEY